MELDGALGETILLEHRRAVVHKILKRHATRLVREKIITDENREPLTVYNRIIAMFARRDYLYREIVAPDSPVVTRLIELRSPVLDTSVQEVFLAISGDPTVDEPIGGELGLQIGFYMTTSGESSLQYLVNSFDPPMRDGQATGNGFVIFTQDTPRFTALPSAERVDMVVRAVNEAYALGPRRPEDL